MLTDVCLQFRNFWRKVTLLLSQLIQSGDDLLLVERLGFRFGCHCLWIVWRGGRDRFKTIKKSRRLNGGKKSIFINVNLENQIIHWRRSFNVKSTSLPRERVYRTKTLQPKHMQVACSFVYTFGSMVTEIERIIAIKGAVALLSSLSYLLFDWSIESTGNENLNQMKDGQVLRMIARNIFENKIWFWIWRINYSGNGWRHLWTRKMNVKGVFSKHCLRLDEFSGKLWSFNS